MSQKAKVIDLRRSFLPTDPNAFPENLGYVQQEDSPEEMVKILPFEGVNFLPTEYGYRSYFGTDATINVAGLASRCSDLLMFQSAGYVNLLVALCEDGIWTSNPATAGGAWTQVYVTTFDPAIFERWTYTVINNAAYFYQEAGTLVYKLTNTPTWSTFTPSFLNMAGQKGIFRAGGRLGFWDSENSVSWSSALDFTDCTPALTTMAGNTKFRDVVGNIVSILAQGDGFVIYSTKSIVGVTLGAGVANLWNANVVANNTGIAYPTHVCLGNSDATHFAFTVTGLYAIGVYNQLNKSHAFAPILTETMDFVRESLNPIRLFMSEGRFLFISLIDSSYIDGIISSTVVTIPGLSLTLLGYAGTEATLTSNQGASLINQLVANPVSYGQPAAAEGYEWDGTYRADIDLLTVGAYLPDPVVSTTHFGTSNLYSPLKSLAAPISHLVNPSVLTVEGAINTWDAWLSAFITGQAAFVAAKIAEPAVITIESFPGVGTYPTIPADPANRITEVGKQLVGTGKDKMIRTGSNTLLNILTLRRYFTDAKRIDARGVIHYTGWVLSTNTWNPADKGPDLMLSGGNLTTTVGNPVSIKKGSGRSLTSKSSGKWYWECTIVDNNSGSYGNFIGVATSLANVTNNIGWDAYGWSYQSHYTGVSYKWNNGVNTAYGATFTAGDIIGVALDMDARTLTFYKNNVSQGVAFTGLPGAMFQAIGAMVLSSLSCSTNTNFGDTAFAYTPPAGHSAVSGYVLQGTVSTTYEATAITGQYGYSEADIRALEFKRYRKNADESWTLVETVAAGGATPPAFDGAYPTNAVNTIAFGAAVIDSPYQSASGYPFAGNPASVLNPYVLPVEGMTITYPPVSFSLTVGTPAPLYPTYVGALVLDTQLKKWGKFKGNHKLVVDYNPQNSTSNGAIPYTNFGIRAGALLTDGKIALFDHSPTESWIRYGKIGYFRKGFTVLLEALAHFRNLSTGFLTIHSSLDGRSLESGLGYYVPFTDAKNVVGYPDISARWHTVKISGKWDLQYLEVRGIVSGRR